MARRPLALWMNGEHVGSWAVQNGEDILVYEPQWVASPQGRPLSLSLPFRPDRTHRGVRVLAYFDNLLPDSQPIRERLASRFRAQTTSAFDLLTALGRDCVGALQLAPENEEPESVRQIHARVLDEAAVAQLIRGTVRRGAYGHDPQDVADLRISLAGAQEKTALLWHANQWCLPLGSTPTTHILKLPLGEVGAIRLDMRDSVDNEWLCAQILAAYGLPVAKCHPLVFEDQRVLGVERFDRQWMDGQSWLVRLPQEDMCQATGTPGHLKYEADGGPGMDRIFQLLGGSTTRTHDIDTFFRAQLLFWALCAPDGHAKNFSLSLKARGAYALTPLYDVLSAYPVLGESVNRISPHKVKLAMAVRSKNAHWRMRDILRRHWVALGRRHGVGTANGQHVDGVIDDLIEQTARVIAWVESQMPLGFPVHVSEPILKGLAAAMQKLKT